MDEINTIIKAHNELQEEKEKKEISELYLMASMTANFVGKILNGKNIPPIYEMFPGVFSQPEQSWETYEAQFMAFAEQHNKQRGGNQ